MPLRSKLFAGDTRLQSCLVNDASHVTPGSQGDFVQKIQTALLILEDVSVAVAELATETYGPSTANAVRNYKTRRQIINRAYQQTVDDIVGKMTIARLDADMVDAERRREFVPPAHPSFT